MLEGKAAALIGSMRPCQREAFVRRPPCSPLRHPQLAEPVVRLSNRVFFGAQFTRTFQGFNRIKQKEPIMKIKSVVIAAILSAAGMAGLMLAHARTNGHFDSTRAGR